MDDLIRRKDAIKAVESLQNCYNGFSDSYDKACIIGLLEEVPATSTCDFWDSESNYCALYRPSAQPEWNNHTVACLLAELFDDTCACNYNGIDEWLPEKCELLDSCPHPVGVACWEQFLKHKAKRRSE